MASSDDPSEGSRGDPAFPGVPTGQAVITAVAVPAISSGGFHSPAEGESLSSPPGDCRTAEDEASKSVNDPPTVPPHPASFLGSAQAEARSTPPSPSLDFPDDRLSERNALLHQNAQLRVLLKQQAAQLERLQRQEAAPIVVPPGAAGMQSARGSRAAADGGEVQQRGGQPGEKSAEGEGAASALHPQGKADAADTLRREVLQLQSRYDRLVLENQRLVEALTKQKVERLSAERQSLAAAAAASAAEGRQRLQQQRLEAATAAQEQFRQQLVLLRQEQQKQLHDTSEAARIAATTKAALQTKLQQAEEELELHKQRVSDVEQLLRQQQRDAALQQGKQQQDLVAAQEALVLKEELLGLKTQQITRQEKCIEALERAAAQRQRDNERLTELVEERDKQIRELEERRHKLEQERKELTATAVAEGVPPSGASGDAGDGLPAIPPRLSREEAFELLKQRIGQPQATSTQVAEFFSTDKTIDLIIELDTQTFECLSMKARLMQRSAEASSWKATSLQLQAQQKDYRQKLAQVEQHRDQLARRLQHLLLAHRRQEDICFNLQSQVRRKGMESRRYMQRNGELVHELAVAAWELHRARSDGSSERTGSKGVAEKGLLLACTSAYRSLKNSTEACEGFGSKGQIALMSHAQLVEHNNSLRLRLLQLSDTKEEAKRIEEEERGARLRELDEELSALQTQLQEVQAERKELAETVQQQLAQKHEMQQRIQELESQLKSSLGLPRQRSGGENADKEEEEDAAQASRNRLRISNLTEQLQEVTAVLAVEQRRNKTQDEELRTTKEELATQRATSGFFKSECTRLQGQLAQLQLLHQQTASRAAAAEERCRSLSTAQDEARGALLASRSEQKKLEQAVEDAERRFKHESLAVTELQAQLQQEIGKASAAQAQLQERLASSQVRIEQLQQQNGTLCDQNRKDLEALQEQLKQIVDMCGEKEDKNKQLEQKLEDRTEEVDELRNKLRIADQQLTESRVRLEEQQKLVAFLQERASTAAFGLSDSTRTTGAELASGSEGASHTGGTSQRDSASVEEGAKVQQQLAQQQTEIGQLRQEIEACRALKQHWQDVATTQQKEQQQAGARLVELREQIEERQKKIDEQRKRADDLQTELEEKTVEVGKLRAALEALERLEEEHRQEHKNAVEASAAAAVENLKAQIVELQGRLQELETKREEAERCYKREREARAEDLKRSEDVRHEIQTLREKKRKLQEEKEEKEEKWRRQRLELEDEVSSLRQQTSSLLRDLERLRTESLTFSRSKNLSKDASGPVDASGGAAEERSQRSEASEETTEASTSSSVLQVRLEEATAMRMTMEAELYACRVDIARKDVELQMLKKQVEEASGQRRHEERRLEEFQQQLKANEVNQLLLAKIPTLELDNERLRKELATSHEIQQRLQRDLHQQQEKLQPLLLQTRQQEAALEEAATQRKGLAAAAEEWKQNYQKIVKRLQDVDKTKADHAKAENAKLQQQLQMVTAERNSLSSSLKEAQSRQAELEASLQRQQQLARQQAQQHQQLQEKATRERSQLQQQVAQAKQQGGAAADAQKQLECERRSNSLLRQRVERLESALKHEQQGAGSATALGPQLAEAVGRVARLGTVAAAVAVTALKASQSASVAAQEQQKMRSVLDAAAAQAQKEIAQLQQQRQQHEKALATAQQRLGQMEAARREAEAERDLVCRQSAEQEQLLQAQGEAAAAQQRELENMMAELHAARALAKQLLHEAGAGASADTVSKRPREEEPETETDSRAAVELSNLPAKRVREEKKPQAEEVATREEGTVQQGTAEEVPWHQPGAPDAGREQTEEQREGNKPHVSVGDDSEQTKERTQEEVRPQEEEHMEESGADGREREDGQEADPGTPEQNAVGVECFTHDQEALQEHHPAEGQDFGQMDDDSPSEAIEEKDERSESAAGDADHDHGAVDGGAVPVSTDSLGSSDTQGTSAEQHSPEGEDRDQFFVFNSGEDAGSGLTEGESGSAMYYLSEDQGAEAEENTQQTSDGNGDISVNAEDRQDMSDAPQESVVPMEVSAEHLQLEQHRGPAQEEFEEGGAHGGEEDVHLVSSGETAEPPTAAGQERDEVTVALPGQSSYEEGTGAFAQPKAEQHHEEAVEGQEKGDEKGDSPSAAEEGHLGQSG